MSAQQIVATMETRRDRAEAAIRVLRRLRAGDRNPIRQPIERKVMIDMIAGALSKMETHSNQHRLLVSD